jgi:hypothetical protein
LGIGDWGLEKNINKLFILKKLYKTAKERW